MNSSASTVLTSACDRRNAFITLLSSWRFHSAALCLPRQLRSVASVRLLGYPLHAEEHACVRPALRAAEGRSKGVLVRKEQTLNKHETTSLLCCLTSTRHISGPPLTQFALPSTELVSVAALSPRPIFIACLLININAVEEARVACLRAAERSHARSCARTKAFRDHTQGFFCK